MASAAPAAKSFAFVFPMASGHINPSLPIARRLVKLGHEVHYLCRDVMREAIEDTGATFHSDVEAQRELYEGREADLMGAMESLKKEFGLEEGSFIKSATKLKCVQLELMIPGTLRFLRQTRPSAVVFCPLMNFEAACAAKVLGIPAVGVLTTAGPGSLTMAFSEFLAMENVEPETLVQEGRDFEPGQAACHRINEAYGLGLDNAADWVKPLGYLKTVPMSALTIVTTSEDLQDPVEAELASKYQEEQVAFAFVGPLLDQEGAIRAMTHKHGKPADGDELRAKSEAKRGAHDASADADLVAKVSAARAAGRRIVLASMGTVVTGDNETLGWNGRMPGVDGKPHGLSGAELCRGAWAGAIDAFGAKTAEEGPLLILVLGPQPDPLGDLVPPPNAVCLPSVPQVDLLRSGIDLFLTHGGQNSFTESMAHGTAVVVCPGFGDQIVNSRKAENLGVGLKVDRPDPDAGAEAEAIARYSADVSSALRKVSAEPAYAAAAARCADNLRQAGGVQRAVELVLSTAAAEAAPAGPGKVMEPAPASSLVKAAAGA